MTTFIVFLNLDLYVGILGLLLNKMCCIHLGSTSGRFNINSTSIIMAYFLNKGIFFICSS